jgi:H+/gluconate symporter-like permease
MKKGIYDNIKQIDALIGETYMYAIIIAIIALVIAYIIANLFNWGGKNDKSHIRRRVWYIIIGIVAPTMFFLYNALFVARSITKAPLLARFSTANVLATLTELGIYLFIGILSMVILRSSKWGSILGKSKN